MEQVWRLDFSQTVVPIFQEYCINVKSYCSIFSGSFGETTTVSDFEEAMHSLEKRALERQSRLEAALLQVSPHSLMSKRPDIQSVDYPHGK